MSKGSSYIVSRKKQESRYEYIDFLKACSSIVIMLYHIPSLVAYEDLQELYPYPFERLLRIIYDHGYIVVELFFVLSGFLLSIHYFTRNKENQSLSCFMGRKVMRLYPAYLLTTFLCIILQVFSLYKTGSTVLKLGFNLNAFWLDLLMLRGGIISSAVPLNVPAWFLSPLFVCYLLFWFIFYERTREPYKTVVFSILLMLAGIIILYNGWNTATFNERIGRGLTDFFAGVLLGIDKMRRDKGRASLLCSIILFFTSVFLMKSVLFKDRYLYIPAAFTCVIFVFILDNCRVIQSLINTKLFRVIYKPIYNLSYAIFLSHYPILTLIAILNRMFNIARFYSEWWFLAGYIFCSISLAVLIKKLERPTQLFLKNLLN